MSYIQRLREVLAKSEETDGPFMLDRTAFTLATAHRARLLNAKNLVEHLPKLRAQVEDCLNQDSSPIVRPMALLLMCDNIDDEDTNGRVSDLIRKDAALSGYTIILLANELIYQQEKKKMSKYKLVPHVNEFGITVMVMDLLPEEPSIAIDHTAYIFGAFAVAALAAFVAVVAAFI